jgi:ParB-like chromosome segregation protein Spo0J
MDPTELIAHYRDGDERGWDEEFAWLRAHHAERLATIRETATVQGILEPVLLGADGRVWDGHHRLCVAIDLGLPTIPVRYA